MAHSLANQHRILSRPMDVHWAGWRSNTIALQQNGWELSAEQSFEYQTLRVAFRHRDSQCVAISQMIEEFRFEAHARGHEFSWDPRHSPALHIQYFAAKINLQMPSMGAMNFKAIDAAPQFISHEIRSIEDMNWFATPLARTEEIIVDPKTVDDLLLEIRKMQSPDQAALRERNRIRQRQSLEGFRCDAQPRQVFHAQVLSLAA